MRLSTSCMSTNQKQWQTQWISIHLNSNNTKLGSHKEHLWQVWSRSLKLFLRRSSKCVSQSEARVAILDFGSN